MLLSRVLQGEGSTVSVAITGFTPPVFSPNRDASTIPLATFTIASLPMRCWCSC